MAQKLTQSNALLVVSSLFKNLFGGSCIPTDFTPDEESPFSHAWHKPHHFGCFEQVFVNNWHLITALAMNSLEQGWCLPEHTDFPAQIFCLNHLSPSFLSQNIQWSLSKIESKVPLCYYLLSKSKSVSLKGNINFGNWIVCLWSSYSTFCLQL